MTNKKNGLWSEARAKALFDFIEEQKKKNVPLIKAFELYAEKMGRKQNSIRNYYYFHLRHFEKNPQEAAKTGVSLKCHSKTVAKKFSETEEKELMANIAKLRGEGKSVRKACLILAKSNIAEMIRLQNKVRQLQKKSFPSLVTNRDKNIVLMPEKKNVVSESEISSLFLGLIKMVQKNALHIAESKIVGEKQKMIEEIKQVQKTAEQKEVENENLKKEKQALITKSKKLESELNDLVIKSKTLSPISKKSEERAEKFATVIKNLEKKSEKSQKKAFQN